MKVLNLDRLVAEKPEKVLSYEGVEYKVKEMSVEDFLELTKVAEQLEGNTSITTAIGENIKLLARAIPEFPTEKLRALPMEHLATIARFVRGDDDLTQADGVEEVEQKKA